ncbi:hypothetical protein BH23CHL7_BH23CHL7_10440 [soil metagenome]
MSHYSFSVHVAAPPGQVFDLWHNLDRMHEWTVGVTRVTDVSGPIDVGASYTVWFGRSPSRTKIIEFDRVGRTVRSRFGTWLLRGETRTTITPEGDGSRLTQEFLTEGLIPAIAARIFATGSWKGSFRGELNTFARIAQTEAGRPDRFI